MQKSLIVVATVCSLSSVFQFLFSELLGCRNFFCWKILKLGKEEQDDDEMASTRARRGATTLYRRIRAQRGTPIAKISRLGVRPLCPNGTKLGLLNVRSLIGLIKPRRGRYQIALFEGTLLCLQFDSVCEEDSWDLLWWINWRLMIKDYLWPKP